MIEVVSECLQMCECEMYKKVFFVSRKLFIVDVSFGCMSTVSIGQELRLDCTTQLWMEWNTSVMWVQYKLQLQTMTWNMSWLLPTCQVVVSVKLLDKWFCFPSCSSVCAGLWLVNSYKAFGWFICAMCGEWLASFWNQEPTHWGKSFINF